MLKLNRVFYSISGSFLLFDQVGEDLVLKNIRKGKDLPLYKINMGKAPDYTLSPWELSLRKDGGEYGFCLFGKEGVYIKGKGAPLVLEYTEPKDTYNANFIIREGNQVRIGDAISDGMTLFTVKKGTLELDAPSNVHTPSSKDYHQCLYIRLKFVPDEDGEFLVALEQFVGSAAFTKSDHLTYEMALKAACSSWTEWRKKLCGDAEEKAESAYVLWSNIAPAGGNFRTDTLVMSKAGMANVWSWDNGFNALALARSMPEMALEQFMALYNHINECGQVPDRIYAVGIGWEYVKPPIQGWLYKRMMEENSYFHSRDVLGRVYPAVKRNTDWWLNYRGETPSYFHGNDSGCDNASCFDFAEHIETPELLALLSVQCEFLSQAAQKLGLKFDAKHYLATSAALAERVLSYYDGGIFTIDVETGAKRYTNALLPLRMLILGDRLPKKISDFIVKRLKEDYLGNYGIASEAIASGDYVENGYWRGPVWAPDQIVFVHSLREMGQTELADEIAERYKRALKENGLSENHDVHTGKALRCKAYTWTACAYLIL